MIAGLLLLASVCAAQTQPAPVTRDDIEQIFQAVLGASKYDANLDDQKPWNKPRREATTGIYKDDEKSLKAFGSPAAALAANSGVNVPDKTGPFAKASHMFVHVPSIIEIAGANRGIVAFVLLHEMDHLVSHDPERVEQHNLDDFNAWCAAHQKDCDSDDPLKVYEPIGDRSRDAFMRPLEDRADMRARTLLDKVKDPKTGEPFGSANAEEALKAMDAWAKKHGLKGDGQHASIKERLKKFVAARKAEERKADRAEADGNRAIDGSGLRRQ